jgi:hypothetical protein
MGATLVWTDHVPPLSVSLHVPSLAIEQVQDAALQELLARLEWPEDESQPDGDAAGALAAALACTFSGLSAALHGQELAHRSKAQLSDAVAQLLRRLLRPPGSGGGALAFGLALRDAVGQHGGRLPLLPLTALEVGTAELLLQQLSHAVMGR